MVFVVVFEERVGGCEWRGCGAVGARVGVVVESLYQLVELVGELLYGYESAEGAAIERNATVGDDGGGVADDNFGGLDFFSQEDHAGGTVGHESHHDIGAGSREQAQAEVTGLVGLEIDAEEWCSLIDWCAVNGAGFFVHFVNGADEGGGFAVGLCKLSDNVS